MGWNDLDWNKERTMGQQDSEDQLLQAMMLTDHGQKLAKELEQRLMHMPVFVPGDPERSAYNEGERAVYQRLYALSKGDGK